jgi:hypothetical protein
VELLEVAIFDDRGYLYLPEVHKTSPLKKILDFNSESISACLIKKRRVGEVCYIVLKNALLPGGSTKR